MKKAEQKRDTLVANLGDINRPLRVRAVRVGFESMAWEDEVLVREGAPAYEPQMEGPAAPTGLKPFPLIHPTIQIRKESYATNYSDLSYLDEYDDEEEELEEDEFEPEDLYNGE